MPWDSQTRAQNLELTLEKMKERFELDPESAVRSQGFIKMFHSFIADDLRASLTKDALKAGVKVIEEAKVFGSFKSKDVDVSVIHPVNGPLLLVGVRSQMSSVGKNVLTYYQDIVGEAISLQERFPMVTTGYAYVHPLEVVPWQRKKGTMVSAEHPNHSRYARMYAGIGSRDDSLYKHQLGSYDHFSYSVVDFQMDPPVLRDDLVEEAVPDLDMSILTFVPRLIETFNNRNLWIENIFEPAELESESESPSDEDGLDDSLFETPAP